MSQKTDLQVSNADLQSILDIVNSLPDKVEAPTYETASLRIMVTDPTVTFIILQVESDTVSVNTPDISESIYEETRFDIPTGSLIYLEWADDFKLDMSADVSIIYSDGNRVLAKATGTEPELCVVFDMGDIEA